MASGARPSKRRRLSNIENANESSATEVTSSEKIDTPDQQEDKGEEQRRTIFVRSLASEVTTELLTEHFSQSYPIKHAVAVLDREKKTCKGYGFVTFTDPEDALQTCKELNGSELLGRKIKVEIAKARHRDEASGDKTAVAGGKIEREAQDARQGPRLIVRNLPWSISSPDQLVNLFRSYGKIKHASIPKKGGKMIGFGVVLIRGHKNAEKAIQGINGMEVDGRTLAVDWAVDKDTWQEIKNRHTEPEIEPPNSISEPNDIKSGSDGSTDGLLSSENETNGEGSKVNLDDDEDFVDEPMDDAPEDRSNENSSTIFVRNLPFSCTDEDLYGHFRQFGPLRYARVVYDPKTEQPRGTGFACFVSPETCAMCLKDAPKSTSKNPQKQENSTRINANSVLQDENLDPSGKYTLDGRVLQVAQAVNKSEAVKLTAEGHERRNARDGDKRRLYLLSEGTIHQGSDLHKQLSPSELAMREASMKQRKSLIQSNPSLHLSLTRLSVRNIPRSVTSSALKDLAREAVVGFAVDVKSGTRQGLSKEERLRGFEDMKTAEHERKLKHKGIVKQAKVVFEGREGMKVKESDGTGRSRGYGFIEYYTHRNALMGLRWLNGHALAKAQSVENKKKLSTDDTQDMKRRLIVEFAIENAQVVLRRRDREVKARTRARSDNVAQTEDARISDSKKSPSVKHKRKRTDDDDTTVINPADKTSEKDTKVAKRSRIIAKKRMLRRVKKDSKKANER